MLFTSLRPYYYIPKLVPRISCSINLLPEFKRPLHVLPSSIPLYHKCSLNQKSFISKSLTSDTSKFKGNNQKLIIEILRDIINKSYPDIFEFKTNVMGEPRTGAFEVILKRGSDNNNDDVTLWSKITTGEPRNLDAAENVSYAILDELRLYL